MAQLRLFVIATPPHLSRVAITPEVERALADHAPVAIGVSGGKDWSAVGIRTFQYLDARGHRGPRLLIHCDLGEIEWSESLPMCERLAASLGTDQSSRWLGDVAPHLLSTDLAPARPGQGHCAPARGIGIANP